jgi:ribonuclease P/MRP protein subunit RPP1
MAACHALVLLPLFVLVDMLSHMLLRLVQAEGNRIVESYEIIAVQPESQQVFQYVCEKAWVDIISFDLSKRLPFFLAPQSIDKAMKRGLMLEINYTATLREGVARRYFMSNAMALIR